MTQHKPEPSLVANGGGVTAAIRPRTILFVFLAIDLALILAFFVSRPLGSVLESNLVMFDVNAEPTFITWYSILKLAAVGVLLLAISLFERSGRSRWWRHWAALGIIFFALSLDEFLQLHERMAAPTRAVFDIDRGAFYLAWVIPGAIFVVVVAVVFLRFVFAQSREVLLLIVASAVIFVGGALGLEIVASAGYSFGGVTSALEELCEMTGMSLFVYALLRRIRESSHQTVIVRIV